MSVSAPDVGQFEYRAKPAMPPTHSSLHGAIAGVKHRPRKNRPEAAFSGLARAAKA
jgi:hypothetical protein